MGKSCAYSLRGTSYQKYLEVIITETLSWSKHCEELRAKASRVLGILQRNLSTCNSLTKEGAYTSLVRRLVNYITTALSLYITKDIAAILNPQREK